MSALLVCAIHETLRISVPISIHHTQISLPAQSQGVFPSAAARHIRASPSRI
ncbi:hypothetical protein IQ07DRAFT_587503 [Pyrenochaeta sp. DS3sAY3a]|nr:hypothetical protein IQ07DRAFT_587503 [Pyrenochaeta sp. DS3sAY3a]